MKNIDVKSLLIGAFLASTVFLGMGCSTMTNAWDPQPIITEKHDYCLGCGGHELHTIAGARTSWYSSKWWLVCDACGHQFQYTYKQRKARRNSINGKTGAPNSPYIKPANIVPLLKLPFK